jgi:hypothetical protein
MKRKQGRPPKYDKVIDQLESYIEDVGKATVNDIAYELFGETDLESKQKTRYIIGRLRARCKKAGRFFYAVRKEHQFLDRENYVDACMENELRWEALTEMLQELVLEGISKFPEIKPRMVNLLGEMQLKLLEYNTKD